MKCQIETCQELGKFRCSRCHLVCYCCQDHQKIDWKMHKLNCNPKPKEEKTIIEKESVTVESSSASSIASKAIEQSEEKEKRICRCMFCGLELILESEEAAIAHMSECIALQEQFQSPDPITIPSMLKEKMKMK